jgi:deazaflavin-dependent oxidoreductase (nitroreductase family)
MNRDQPFPQRHLAEDCCMLTTIGWRSGSQHRVEIWFAVDRDNTLYLIAGNRERCHWLRNAQANPEVTIEVGGETMTGRARRVTDPDERRRAGELMTARYGYYAGDADIDLSQHQWRWEVPVLAIEQWH